MIRMSQAMNLVEDLRPFVPVAEVGVDAERDVVVDGPNDLCLDVEVVQVVDDDVHQPLGV
jgi:hypothetical protein